MRTHRRHDPDGRLRPQTVIVRDKNLARDWTGEPTVLEIHYYSSLRLAIIGFDWLCGELGVEVDRGSVFGRTHAESDRYSIYIAAPLFTSNIGDVCRLYRRGRSDRYRDPVVHVLHFTEKKSRGAWVYSELEPEEFYAGVQRIAR